MSEIDIQADLNAVNDQITKMVEELNRISSSRDQMFQQIQNMNGVAMYLRGKLPPEEQSEPVAKEAITEPTTGKKKDTDSAVENDITRTVEYP